MLANKTIVWALMVFACVVVVSITSYAIYYTDQSMKSERWYVQSGYLRILKYKTCLNTCSRPYQCASYWEWVKQGADDAER